MSRLISFAVLIAIIIIIGLLFYKVLIGFFIPVFLACVLVVIFRPLHHWVLAKTGHRDRLAAAVTTLLIVLILFLPIAVVGAVAATQGLALIKTNDTSTIIVRWDRIRDSLKLSMPEYKDRLRNVDLEISQIVEQSRDAFVEEENPDLINLGRDAKRQLVGLQTEVQKTDGPRWDSDFESLITIADSIGTPSEDGTHPSRIAIRLKEQFTSLKSKLLGGGMLAFARETADPTPEEVEQWKNRVVGYVQPRLLSLTGATGTLLVKLIFGSVILVVATFFFLYDGPSMVKTLMHLSPLDDAYEQELLLEFDRISRAVVLATLLSAIVQGLTAGLGYAVVGMNYLTLLIMLTTVFAMVPFVGPAVIWVPVCLYVGIYEERLTAALLLAAWGVLVVGTVDNLVKALVLHGQSQLHPLLALLSVLGGVQALGPIGIVVGPMVVAMLQTLLSILQRELIHFESHELVFSTEKTGRKKVRKRKSKTKKASQSDAAKTDASSEPASSDASSNVATNGETASHEESAGSDDPESHGG